MTKIEKNKLENLCIHAIEELKESESLYNENNKDNRDCKYATIPLRRADSKSSYALGIHQSLLALGYESKNMSLLTSLLR